MGDSDTPVGFLWGVEGLLLNQFYFLDINIEYFQASNNRSRQILIFEKIAAYPNFKIDGSHYTFNPDSLRFNFHSRFNSFFW